MIEVLKQALEALELNNDEWKSLADSGDAGCWRAEDQDHYKQTNKAITDIKAALAQPEERNFCPRCGKRTNDIHTCTPPQRTEQEPVQEPYKGLSEHMMQATNGRVRIDPVTGNTGIGTPPQRTWVGLTDEEENEYNYLGPDMHWVIQEIAAKLKEKNT